MWKQRIIYLLVLLGAGVFYFAFSGYLSFFVLRLAVFLPVLLFGLNLAIWFTIRAIYDFPMAVQLRAGEDGLATRGQDALFDLEVENETIFHFPLMRFTFTIENMLTGEQIREKVCLPLNSHDTVHLTLNTHCRHCGNLRVTLQKARCCDCLGLTSLPFRLRQSATVLVLPDIYPMEQRAEIGATHSDEGLSYAPDRPGNDSSQVFDFHEYREGDRIKNIHWKLSNRLDRMMVKEFSEPISSTVRVVLELNGGKECPPELLDGALSACMSLSESLLSQGYSYSLEWMNRHTGEPMRMRIPAPDGAEEFLIALGEVCAAAPSAGTPLLDHIRTQEVSGVSDVFYITPLLDEETAGKLIAFESTVPLNVVCAGESAGTAELLETSALAVTVWERTSK